MEWTFEDIAYQEGVPAEGFRAQFEVSQPDLREAKAVNDASEQAKGHQGGQQKKCETLDRELSRY